MYDKKNFKGFECFKFGALNCDAYHKFFKDDIIPINSFKLRSSLLITFPIYFITNPQWRLQCPIYDTSVRNLAPQIPQLKVRHRGNCECTVRMCRLRLLVTFLFPLNVLRQMLQRTSPVTLLSAK